MTTVDRCRVVPYLLYADVEAALAFLGGAFGFSERLRVPAPDGGVRHAEMNVPGGGLVMLGGAGADFLTPKKLGTRTQLVFVYVDDVDALHARALAAGALIVSELDDRDYGRTFAAEDPEGHHWSFTSQGEA